MSIKDKIKGICDQPSGVDLLGVSPVKRFQGLPENKRPEYLLAGARSVIVLGSQMFKTITDRLTVENRVGEVSYQDIYSYHKDTVDRDLQQTGYRIARFLTNEGYPSLNLGENLVDDRVLNSVFSFKYAAVAAGLGIVGKSGLLITPDYGPRLRLNVIITEADLKEDTRLTEDLCKDCNSCIKACPAGALQEPEAGKRVNYDSFICYSFYNANDGCSLCLSKCPC